MASEKLMTSGLERTDDWSSSAGGCLFLGYTVNCAVLNEIRRKCLDQRCPTLLDYWCCCEVCASIST